MSEWLWGGGRVAGEWTGGGWKQTGKSLSRQARQKVGGWMGGWWVNVVRVGGWVVRGWLGWCIRGWWVGGWSMDDSLRNFGSPPKLKGFLCKICFLVLNCLSM